MSPDAIGALVNGATPSFAGIFLTLMSVRIVGEMPGESAQFEAFPADYANRMNEIRPTHDAIRRIPCLCGHRPKAMNASYESMANSRKRFFDRLLHFAIDNDRSEFATISR